MFAFFPPPWILVADLLHQRTCWNASQVIALKRQLAEVNGEQQSAGAGRDPTRSCTSSGPGGVSTANSLKSYEIGERCQAVYEQDGHWYNAKVVALAQDGYFVTYLGYGNTAQVDFAEVRPYVRPDTREWKAGCSCMALSPADNRWYEGRVVNVKAATATIRFAGDVELHEIELDAVRVSPPSSTTAACALAASSSTTASGETSAGSAVASSGMPGAAAGASAASTIPRQMEIRPDDSEEVVARKKKKLAMFKRQERREKEEKHGDERRTSWQSFSAKNKTISKAKNYHDPTWDPTRDHGEIADRVAMDKHAKYIARNDH